MRFVPVAVAPIAVVILTLSASAWAQTPPPTPPAAPSATAQMPAMDESHRVKAEDIDKALAEGKVLLLDVREQRELEESGTIPDSLHIPIGQLEQRLAEVPKDRLILTACQGGGRASRAAALLEKHGYKTAGFCGLRDYKGKRVYPKAPGV